MWRSLQPTGGGTTVLAYYHVDVFRLRKQSYTPVFNQIKQCIPELQQRGPCFALGSIYIMIATANVSCLWTAKPCIVVKIQPLTQKFWKKNDESYWYTKVYFCKVWWLWSKNWVSLAVIKYLSSLKWENVTVYESKQESVKLSNITPVLRSLHWLPVTCRIGFKWSSPPRKQWVIFI